MRLRKIMSRASCLVLNGYAAATRGRHPTNKYSRAHRRCHYARRRSHQLEIAG